MQMLLRAARLGLAIAATAAMPIQAQELYTSQLKLRVGSYQGAVSEKSLGHRTQGLGVEIARKTGKGQMFAEFTYDLFNGYRKDVTQLGVAAWYAGDATQDPWNPSAPSTYWTDANGASQFLTTNANYSLFGEMLEYQGFGLRLGYRAPLTYSWAQGWDWQAGITFDRRETRHEVMMTLTPGYYSTDPVSLVTTFNQIPPIATDHIDTKYYEGARFTHNTKDLELGAFVGVSHAFGDIFRTDINLRYTNFKTPHYNPFTYTGKVPTTINNTRGGLVLEVAIGITL